MKKVLITGATGFAGSHLIEYLMSHGDYEITGTTFSPLQDQPTGWKAVQVDLTNEQAVNQLVESTNPDWIFHLAALSSPSASFSDHHQTLISNIVMQVYLFEAAAKHCPTARILITGSAEEYGRIESHELPVNESQPLRPINPYAVSKVTQDLLGYQYHHSHKLNIIRVRPFNHTGPRQTPQFVIPAFAQQIAKIEAGQQEPIIKVGNLSAVRDFSDVRDIVKAYVLAMEKGEAGDVYNLGSGKGVTIDTVLKLLLTQTTQPIQIVQDPNRMQPSDAPLMQADITKFSSLTDWQPQFNLEETIRSVLDYWRQEVKKN